MPSDPGPAAWDAILAPGPRYGALDRNRTADWLIIGAGFAGLAAARQLRLLHPTDSIIMLEARQIAEGPVGRNSGFMIDLPHNLVSEDYAGALEADRIQTGMNRAAIDFAERAAQDYGFSPDAFVRSGKINAAATQKGTAHNVDYAAHLSALGETHELYDAAQMRALCGSSYYQSGLYTPGTAMLQPALFAREMAAGLASQEVTIHENAAVHALDRGGAAWVATTSGGSVTAPKVILAVNGHVESFGHFRKRLIHIYLYGSMTRSLTPGEERTLGGEAIWGLTPADPMGTTLRRIRARDGTRIVVRNGVTWNPARRSGAREVARIGAVHDRTFRARFPMLAAVTMQHRWGGLLCLSRNASSAFGEIEPGLYSACCQNGLGAAKGTLSGMLAADLASGRASDHLDHILSKAPPTRVPPQPFASIGANAVMRWKEFRAGAER